MDKLVEEYNSTRRKAQEEFNANAYYFIVAIVSILMLVFLPMLGTQVGLELDLPTTTIGWVVYCVIKVIVAAANVLIFHSFVQQGKINIRDDNKYLKANEILITTDKKNYVPQSPKKFFAKLYISKGSSIFFSTLVSVVALTQALLAFDFLSFITYLFTIIMGLIFGVMTMFKVEDYWTNEYFEYANYIKEQSKDGN